MKTIGLLTVSLFAIAMASGTQQPPDTQQKSSTTKAQPAQVPATAKQREQNLEFAALLWGPAKRPDGSLRYWNPAPLIDIKASLASVYYRPRDKDGKPWHKVGIIPPKMLEETLANAVPELRESHAHGIKIVGYADSILFHPDMLQAEGVAHQSLYARDAGGNAVINNGWDRGAGVSCLNNPGWLALQKRVAMVTAQAGFDGLMFDIYPYFISPGYECHCQHCQDEWEAYSLPHLGQKAPFPKQLRREDPTTERTFYKWRMQAYADFVSAIETHVHAKHPGFMILMNHVADLPDFAFQASVGALSNPTTEVNHVRLGDEPSLYMHRRMEALNGRPLITTLNKAERIRPAYRYKVAIAEAYAGGGLIYAIMLNDPTVLAYYRFIQNNEDRFLGMRSDATVAVLYSLNDHSNALQGHSNAHGVWKKCSDRRAATVLAQLGVPYDYIHLDRKQKRVPLARYRTLVAPPIAMLDDDQAAELKQFVQGGGQLLCLGNLGEFREEKLKYVRREKPVLEEWTGEPLTTAWNATLGKGRIAYLPTESPKDADLKRAAEFVDLNSQLRVEAGSIVETAVRGRDDQRVIHLIRLGPPENLPDRSVHVDYEVPAGYDVRSCEVLSPDCPAGTLEAAWRQVGRRLHVDIEHLETYGLIVVNTMQ